MSAKIKSVLYGIISLVGNGAILAVLPDPYKLYAFLAFNLVQVIYAFYDNTYHVQLLSKQAPPQA